MSVFAAAKNLPTEKDRIIFRRKALLSLRALDSASPFFTPLPFNPAVVGAKNCENLIGSVGVPVGIAGPVSAELITGNSSTLLTDLLIPLATTEGALVASINRGCKLLQACNRVEVKVENVGMTRAPVFRCASAGDAENLTVWLENNLPSLGKIGEQTSAHLRFLGCRIFCYGNLVFPRFAFDSGEAMGMNMVTIAVDAISRYVIARNPGCECLALSSNVCTDKKVSKVNRKFGRGRRVMVTADITSALINSILKTDVDRLFDTYQAKIVIGSRLAGLAGRNMQLANVAAAILIATGQDPAHTADISQGTIVLKKNSAGISAKLILPTVPVGSVGGGTSLPAQKTARQLISPAPVTADILAAALGLASLAGELSGLAALSTQTLASSHQKLAR